MARRRVHDWRYSEERGNLRLFFASCGTFHEMVDLKQVIDKVSSHLTAFLLSTVVDWRLSRIAFKSPSSGSLSTFGCIRVASFLDTASSRSGNSSPATLRVNTDVSYFVRLYGESRKVVDSFTPEVLPVAIQSRGLWLDDVRFCIYCLVFCALRLRTLLILSCATWNSKYTKRLWLYYLLLSWM
jgi:hypothetical protein